MNIFVIKRDCISLVSMTQLLNYCCGNGHYTNPTLGATEVGYS